MRTVTGIAILDVLIMLAIIVVGVSVLPWVVFLAVCMEAMTRPGTRRKRRTEK